MREGFVSVMFTERIIGAIFLTPYLTVPQDYDDLLSYYTKRGYRVIAIAGKSIEGLSWLRAQKLKRCVS